MVHAQAVEVLSDPGKRLDYDRKLKLEEGGIPGFAPSTAAEGGGADDRGEGSASGFANMEMDMPCRSCRKSHAAVFTDLPA